MQEFTKQEFRELYESIKSFTFGGQQRGNNQDTSGLEKSIADAIAIVGQRIKSSIDGAAEEIKTTKEELGTTKEELGTTKKGLDTAKEGLKTAKDQIRENEKKIDKYEKILLVQHLAKQETVINLGGKFEKPYWKWDNFLIATIFMMIINIGTSAFYAFSYNMQSKKANLAEVRDFCTRYKLPKDLNDCIKEKNDVTLEDFKSLKDISLAQKELDTIKQPSEFDKKVYDAYMYLLYVSIGALVSIVLIFIVLKCSYKQPETDELISNIEKIWTFKKKENTNVNLENIQNNVNLENIQNNVNLENVQSNVNQENIQNNVNQENRYANANNHLVNTYLDVTNNIELDSEVKLLKICSPFKISKFEKIQDNQKLSNSK